MSTVEGGFRLNIVKPGVWARLDARFAVFFANLELSRRISKIPFHKFEFTKFTELQDVPFL